MTLPVQMLAAGQLHRVEVVIRRTGRHTLRIVNGSDMHRLWARDFVVLDWWSDTAPKVYIHDEEQLLPGDEQRYETCDDTGGGKQEYRALHVLTGQTRVMLGRKALQVKGGLLESSISIIVLLTCVLLAGQHRAGLGAARCRLVGSP